MKKPRKPMTGKELVEKMKAREVVVEVPEADMTVLCRVPDHNKVYDLRINLVSGEDFKHALFKACLVDVSAEEIEQMQNGNGVLYMLLFNAVMGSVDLFGVALSTGHQKN